MKYQHSTCTHHVMCIIEYAMCNIEHVMRNIKHVMCKLTHEILVCNRIYINYEFEHYENEYMNMKLKSY